VWWLRLGITIQRIQPGHPQQNGRHERMHLTLKPQTTRPAGGNSLQQQSKFDDFLEEFNNQRPHEALDLTLVEASSGRSRVLVRNQKIVKFLLSPDGENIAYTTQKRYETADSQQIVFDLGIIALSTMNDRIVAPD